MHRPRRYSDIASVPKQNFFDVLGEGMWALAAHVASLVAAAERCIEAGDEVAAEILAVIAREEAGKFLILLDTARLPRHDKSRVTRQLKRAGSHLAKSLYFKMSQMSPATLSEVDGLLKEERRTHFLDGPNDFDWIFRNRALASREDVMYVDYQETDDGFVWQQPSDGYFGGVLGVGVYAMIGSMRTRGFCEPAALALINGIWESFVPSNGSDGPEETHWAEIKACNWETLQKLEDQGIGAADDDSDAALIADRWTFPLHSVDLSSIDTTKTVVDEKRRLVRGFEWDEAGYADIASEQWDDGPVDLARERLEGLGGDELDIAAEMRREKKAYIAEERARFISED